MSVSLGTPKKACAMLDENLEGYYDTLRVFAMIKFTLGMGQIMSFVLFVCEQFGVWHPVFLNLFCALVVERIINKIKWRWSARAWHDTW